MFHHHTHISPNHHLALESAVKTHRVEPENLARLYRTAQDLVQASSVKPSPSILTSVLRGDIATIAVATDSETGVYVQLAQTPEAARLWLTVGQKWAMESPNTASSTSATRLW